MENLLGSWWWYALFSALVLFLMSWQRAHGFAESVRIEETGFIIGSPAWQIPVSGAECSGLLSGYPIEAGAVTTQSTPEATLFESSTDQARASFALSVPCPAPLAIEIPVSSYSAYLEKPWLTASYSGEQRFSLTSDGDRIALYWSEKKPMRLDVFFPSVGDQVILGTASAFRPNDFPDRSLAVSESWGETGVISSMERGWNRLVSSTMFTPTAPSQVRPVSGCTSRSSLAYPLDHGADCQLVDWAELNVPKYSWRGRNLFASQPSGQYAPVILPPSEKPTLPGEVVISEIMWAGSFRGDLGLDFDEWLELANLTTQRFSLRGLKIEGAAVAGGTLLVNVDLFLEPYGLIIIGRRGGANTELARDPDWVTTELSLNNNGAQLVLRAQNGIELDRTPVGSWLAGKNDTATKIRASAQRRQLNLSGIDWNNWGDCAGELAQACLVRGHFWRSGNRANLATPWQPNVL